MSDYRVLLQGRDAKEKLRIGSEKLASLVVSTLGPRSRNVAINRVYPSPAIIHDGVKIAREIVLKDPFEDMGASLVRDAASKTDDLAGDGTTTATLLANCLIQEGFKLVEGGVVDGVISGKVNPMILREKLLKYSKKIITELDKRAIKLTDKSQWEAVAKISSGDGEIGKLVADAIEAVGKDGVVMVEEAAGFESSLQLTEGMEFENGYLSPLQVTDTNEMIAYYENAYILLTDYRIADAMMLVPLIEKIIKHKNSPLLIIADDVTGPALKAVNLTKIRTGAQLVTVMAPEYADRRKEMLEDLAVLTGGKVITFDAGLKLEDVNIADLGQASSIKVTATHTTIVPKFIDTEEVNERIESVKKQMQNETNDFRKQRLEYRLGKLSGKVAVINVGGSSDAAITEKKERVVDAVHATKAALSEGIIPGGGIVLKEIATTISIDDDKEPNSEIVKGLVVECLNLPFKQLMINSGEDIKNIEMAIDVLPDKVKNKGYDVVSRRAGDLFKMGIIDPVKVTKLAITHSFEVASTILTTEGLISEDLEEDRKNAQNKL